MLPAKRFDKLSEPNKVISAEPSESLAATGDDPSHVTLKGKRQISLNVSATVLTEMTQLSEPWKELGTEQGLRSNEWQEKDSLVLYRGKIYVPHDSQLRLDIVKAHHDYPVVGHPGQ